jgi:hypothetical protein
METGSVIASDNAVKTLAIVASRNIAFKTDLLPYLIKHLETCRAKDVPQHAEATLVAIGADDKDEFRRILDQRLENLSIAQAKRLKKVISEAEER